MSWLRIDDGFANDPKVTALSHPKRWTWLAILCYCARYKTDGWLPPNIAEHVAGAKPGFLHECVDLGLLEIHGGEHQVHHWSQFNPPKDPTKAERQARWRASQRNGPVDDPVDDQVDETVDSQNRLPRARASAPVPVPSLTTSRTDTETENNHQKEREDHTAGHGHGHGDELEHIDPDAELDWLREEHA